MTLYTYTLWPSIYDLTHPVTVTETWDQFVVRFGHHTSYPAKDQAPGFSPVRLAEPHGGTCLKHPKVGPLTTPHRCDACVVDITLAVFDADLGTPEQLLICNERLDDANIARLWYSSWSFTPDSPMDQPLPMRLVLPLSSPVPAGAWARYRRQLIDDFAIPADPAKCSGASHFYYGPSAPSHTLARAITDVVEGYPVEVPERLPTQAPKLALTTTALDPDLDEPANLVDDLPLLRATLHATATRWARSSIEATRMKAQLIDLALQGAPLSPAGGRNSTTFRTAGIVAHLIPDASKEAIVELLRPALESMQAQGSSLRLRDLERFVSTALVTARAQRRQKAALAKQLAEGAAEARRRRQRQEAGTVALKRPNTPAT